VSVQIGVDVGGTFTKAVGCDPLTGRVVARSVVPTSHHAPRGVAEGVVAALGEVVREVERLGAGPVTLVSHSTTQAVNALLEGDTATVGILGIGHRPDLGRARRRTRVGEVRLAPGRALRTAHEFLDGTDGVDQDLLREAVRSLRDRGAEVLVATEAFAVEDPSAERAAMGIAAEMGLPASAGHELTGLYGLQVRTVTAAINASILPAALAAADTVERAVLRDAPGVPLMVMRGDGGVADLAAMRRRPLLTAFSGPAASVAGALRHLAIGDGVVVEVGGTSTNVCVIKGGRPVLSYIRVLDHVTSVRSLDVRVAGVAGGSLLRLRDRWGRSGVAEAGPRSAHIAGLPYACFADLGDLEGADVQLSAPRAGDPPSYVVLQSPRSRFALTLTCASNALGAVPDGAYASGDPEAARLGFRALGSFLGREGDEVARQAVDVAARRVGTVVAEVIDEHGLRDPVIVGLGGGAGALVPSLARLLDREWRIPPEAEVISSIGDALSPVRVEVEGAMARPSAASIAALVRQAEDAAAAAGADPATLEVETEALPERGALRAVATGSVALAAPDASEASISPEDIKRAATIVLGQGSEEVGATDAYTVFATGRGARRRFAVLDGRGSVALEGWGLIVAGTGDQVSVELRDRLPAMVRRFGPVGVAPAVRLLRGKRLVDLSLFSSPDEALRAAVAECELADGDPVVALVTRE
jgi:N-methylhydantoinase A/oxoprolinase/acetone carboxylase beta subunit